MKGMGAVMGIIMIMVAFIMFPLIMTGTHDILTDASTEIANVTTAGGITTADVTLSPGLYNDDTDSVLAVTSSLGTDAPVAGSYVAATDALTVTGLTAADNRLLTVSYEYEATTDYTGMGALARMAPTLIFLALLGAGVGIVVAAWRGRN